MKRPYASPKKRTVSGVQDVWRKIDKLASGKMGTIRIVEKGEKASFTNQKELAGKPASRQLA